MRFLISIVFLFTVTVVYSQGDYSTKNKKAIAIFENALAFYNQGNLESTRIYIKLALEKDPNFIEPYLLLADMENELQHFDKEIEAFKKVMEINPDFNPKIYFTVAKSEMKTGYYSEAVKHLVKCLTYTTLDSVIENEAGLLLQKAEFGAWAVEHPVPFIPINLGPYVNTKYKDYWPSLTADEKTLIFTSQLPTNMRMPSGATLMQEDFFVTYKADDGNWSPSMNVGPPLNTDDNEGAQNISADGRYLFYTACNRKEDFGSCDIYFSMKVGNSWTEPKNIGPPVSTNFWESNPAPSSDGRVLFIASGGRPDGKGGRDLYLSRKLENGKWSEPENLGDSINTSGNEYAPFIHPDGKTLYFSSDGWPGMGGQDIFYSRLKRDGTWSSPINIGYPINTYADDFGFIVNTKGNFAYYSSNRKGTVDWDIFGFDLYPEARPTPVTYVAGIVYDAVTKQKLEAGIQILELVTNDTIAQVYSDSKTGAYLACLPAEHDYAMNVSKSGYLFYSDNFSLKGLPDVTNTYKRDVYLQPIEPGARIVLKNIFFDTDLFNLKPESTAELGKLISFLKDNPGVSVEIGGHTDNVGSNEHNIKLSQNRAKAVFDYLVNHGIGSKRMTYKGYSFSSPLATNDTEEGRALNRRTEMVITSVK
jgi:outer membrane protein OmpA-like peptidoglycan-associated protein